MVIPQVGDIWIFSPLVGPEHYLFLELQGVRREGKDEAWLALSLERGIVGNINWWPSGYRKVA